MTTKEQKLYSFYSQCNEKGYIDMTDDTQSLKAKVIASDLGLRYGKISNLFEEARVVYEREESRKEEEAQKAAAEEARTAVPGDLVLTLKEDSNSIEVFRRPDKSIYCTHNGGNEKFEGAPDIEIRKGGVLTYTYHPSKTVFTGASSGGIAMGGFHQTEAYNTEKVSATGKGDIHAKSYDLDIWVKRIDLSPGTADAFKRDEIYNRLRSGNSITCIDTSNSLSREMIGMAMKSSTSFEDKMSKMSMAVDMSRLPMAKIQEIAEFLNNAISGNYPETDEGYYTMALTLMNGTKSEELRKAADIFKKISDYKDSAEKAKEAEQKYADILQSEKEQKILQKEKDTKRLKKTLAVSIPIIIAVIIGGTIASNNAKKQTAYNFAEELAESGQYDEAIEAFQAINGYKDSNDKISEIKYEKAMVIINCLDEENPENIVDFGQAGIDKDINSNLDVKRIIGASLFFSSDKDKEARNILTELGSYRDCENTLYRLNKEETVVKAMFRSITEAGTLAEDLSGDGLLVQSVHNVIEMYKPYCGEFYWQGIKSMGFVSDFRLEPYYNGKVEWLGPEITDSAKVNVAKYPSLIVDGKTTGIVNSVRFVDLRGTDTVEDFIDVEVNLENGMIFVRTYYNDGDSKKTAMPFYACPDSTDLKESGEKFLNEIMETVRLEKVEEYYKQSVYGKAKVLLDEMPDSEEKKDLMTQMDQYLPYLGTWEFASGDSALFMDDHTEQFRTPVECIIVETGMSVYGHIYISVYKMGDTEPLKNFSVKDGTISNTINSGMKSEKIYSLSITDTGNLLLTEKKEGKEFTAEYKKADDRNYRTEAFGDIRYVSRPEKDEEEVKKTSKTKASSSKQTASQDCYVCGKSATQKVGSYWYCSDHAKLVKDHSYPSNNNSSGYDMPNSNDKSFSDYVKRVDPDLYNSMVERYDNLK